MRIIGIIFLATILAGVFFAQTPPEGLWTKISSKKGDFSVSVPSDFLAHQDRKDRSVSLVASRPGVSYQVLMRLTEQAKAMLGSSGEIDVDNDVRPQRFSVGDFVVDVYLIEKETVSYSIHAASGSAYFSIVATTNSKENTDFARFLASISLGGKPLLKGGTVSSPVVEKSITADKLETNPVVNDALSHTQKEKITIVTDPTPVEKERKEFYSRPWMLLTREQPDYPISAREAKISGTVNLRIVFKADGDIGTITLVKGLPGGLSQSAIAVAKKIKFLPAEIDGKPVDVVKSLEFTFSILF